MAPHSSTLAWKIPWTEEPGRLQSIGSLSQTRLSDLTFHFPSAGWAPGPQSPGPGIVGAGVTEACCGVLGVSPRGLPGFPRCPGAELPLLSTDDSMEGVDSERRPHFPQFSYSASGTA